MSDLVYKVEDKSILLPFYRRWLVQPALPFIPAKIAPNAITHAGHVVNLAGTLALLLLWPDRGWPYFTAALSLNFYTWCDNADGSHARRTNQCSSLGEFLDHGLDQFNMVYMACLSAIGLGASPLAWLCLLSLVPAAAVTTFWEQTHTGVFRMGRLNHIESVVLLTVVLVTTGVHGHDVWDLRLFESLTLRDTIIWGSLAGISFSIAANVFRVVRQCGMRPTPILAVFIVASGTVFTAAARGALPLAAALALISALNVHLGVRMLVRRVMRRFPRRRMAPSCVHSRLSTTGHLDPRGGQASAGRRVGRGHRVMRDPDGPCGAGFQGWCSLAAGRLANEMNRRSLARGVRLLVGVITVTFAYLTISAVREHGSALSACFTSMKPAWFVVGAFFALLEPICGGLRMWVLGRVLCPALRVRSAIVSEFVLMFGAGVTPGQAGGAPAQMVMLTSAGMKLADVASAQTLVASCTLLFFMLSAVIVFWLKEKGLLLVAASREVDWLLLVAVVSFGAILIVVVLAATYPPLAKGCVRLLTAVSGPPWRAMLRGLARLGRTRLIAQRGLARQGSGRARLMILVDDFHRAFRAYVRNGKRAGLIALLLTAGFFCSRFSVPYFILLGLGLPPEPATAVTVGPPVVQIIIVQALINFALYLAPTPGAGGIAEGSSKILMSPWVNGAHELPYLLIWRLLCLSLSVFIGAIYVFRFLSPDVLDEKLHEAKAAKPGGE